MSMNTRIIETRVAQLAPRSDKGRNPKPGIDDVRHVVESRVAVLDLVVQRADPEIQQYGQEEDHRRVSEREEEADTERSFPSLIRFRV